MAKNVITQPKQNIQVGYLRIYPSRIFHDMLTILSTALQGAACDL